MGRAQRRREREQRERLAQRHQRGLGPHADSSLEEESLSLRHMAASAPGRVIEVAWGVPRGEKAAVYPLDVVIEASDRPGLLRDISEVFVKERMNVTGVHTQTAKDRSSAWLTFTVEATDAALLAPVLTQINRVAGVRHVRRK